MERKGVTLISGVLFLAITIAATVIVYYAAVPVVERVRDAAVTEQTGQAMVEIDKIVREVAGGGKGTKRTFTLRTEAGTFEVNDTKDTIKWTYETSSPIVSPRVRQEVGNLVVGSNLEASVSRGNYSSSNAWVLENEHLVVYLNRSGNASDYRNTSTDRLFLAMYQKDEGAWLNGSGMVEFGIDDAPTSQSGNGYTVAEREGEDLPYGRVTMVVNSTYRLYFVNVTLEAGADFVTIEPFV